jgi:hypothetical protein
MANASQGDTVNHLTVFLPLVHLGRALPNHSGRPTPDFRRNFGHEAPHFGVHFGPFSAGVLLRHGLQDPDGVTVGPAEARESDRTVLDANILELSPVRPDTCVFPVNHRLHAFGSRSLGRRRDDAHIQRRQATRRIGNASQNVRRAKRWTQAHQAGRLNLCAGVDAVRIGKYLIPHGAMTPGAGAACAQEAMSASYAKDAFAAIGANDIATRAASAKADAVR